MILSIVLRLFFAAVVLAVPHAGEADGATARRVDAIPARAASLVKVAVMNFADLPEAPAGGGAPAALQPETTIPLELPVPDEIQSREALERSAARAPFGTTLAAASPAAARSFAGLADDAMHIPPDTNGAAGPHHLLETLNSQVRISDRFGKTLSTVTLDSFFSAVGSTLTFDPRVVYDPFAGRWIVCATAAAEGPDSHLLLAVSQSSDPTGLWNVYRITGDSGNPKTYWLDRPSLGFNHKWIAVQVNLFTLSGNSFDGTSVYLFDKSAVDAGLVTTPSVISTTTIGGSQVPAVTYDNSVDPLFFVQAFNSNTGGKGYLRLYSVSGSIGSESMAPVNFAILPAPWDPTPPGDADSGPQQGTSNKITLGDGRIQNVVYRSGALWATQTIFLPAGGAASRASIQWVEMGPDATVLQAGRIDDASGQNSYAYPSIAVNHAGDALLGFSALSANSFASCAYALRAASDPAGTFEAPVGLKAGEATYFKTFGGDANRWGDYSLTVVDPVNDADFWTIQEYAAVPSSGADHWATWWGEITRGGTAAGCGSNPAGRNCTQPISVVPSRKVGSRPSK